MLYSIQLIVETRNNNNTVSKPVGMNLVLVRRVITIHESGASEARGASNGVGSRGPLKGPWRGPGAEPRRGSGGSAPEALGF